MISTKIPILPLKVKLSPSQKFSLAPKINFSSKNLELKNFMIWTRFKKRSKNSKKYIFTYPWSGWSVWIHFLLIFLRLKIRYFSIKFNFSSISISSCFDNSPQFFSIIFQTNFLKFFSTLNFLCQFGRSKSRYFFPKNLFLTSKKLDHKLMLFFLNFWAQNWILKNYFSKLSF